MKVVINLDNSYCTYSSDDFDRLFTVVNSIATFTQSYYVKRRGQPRPEIKQRQLTFFQIKDKSLIVSRGWMWDIIERLDLLGIEYELYDNRRDFNLSPIIPAESLEYFPYQIEAANEAIRCRYGILHLPTGSGKSIIAMKIFQDVGGPMLIMVPSRLLMHQFKKLFEDHFSNIKIGLIGDKEFSIGDVTIGVINSLFLKQNKLAEYYKTVKVLIIDEGHRIRENSYDLGTEYFQITLLVNASMKIALTATPGQDKSLKRRLLEGAVGGLIFHFTGQDAREFGIIVPMNVFVLDLPLIEYKDLDHFKSTEINLLNNKFLDGSILAISNLCKSRNIPLLIICDRVEKQLLKLESLISESKILYGATESEERLKIIQSFEEGEIPVLISTIIKEGISIKNIHAIILAGGGKDSDSLIQKFGRGLRAKEGKTHLTLIDFRYDKVQNASINKKEIKGILYRHSLNRIKTYKKEGYPVTFIKEVNEIEW